MAARFLSKGTEYKVGPKTIVYKAGEPYDPERRSIYYLISGSVRLAGKLKDGRLVVRTVKPGEIFGAEEAFAERERRFTAISAAPCSIYAWTRGDYEMIVGTYAELAKSGIANLSALLRKTNRLIEDFKQDGCADQKMIVL